MSFCKTKPYGHKPLLELLLLWFISTQFYGLTEVKNFGYKYKYKTP